MKKKIGILCIILLIFIVGFLLYFSNGSTIPVFGKGTFSLEDYYHSIKADFHYVKDNYQVEKVDDGDYPIVNLINGDKSINFTFIENYSNAIEKDMHLLEEDDKVTDLKEIKYSKYKGYYYRYNDEYSYVMLILDCVESERLSKDTCTSLEVTVNEEFTKDVEDIIKSISFSKLYNGSLKLDGIIASNHKFGIKRFTLEDLKVDIYKMESGINVEIFNEESVFKAEIRESKESHEYKEEIVIDDITLYDSMVTSENEIYKNIHSGNFTKELNFDYKFYSNVDDEVTKKYISKVINNIEIIK